MTDFSVTYASQVIDRTSCCSKC